MYKKNYSVLCSWNRLEMATTVFLNNFVLDNLIKTNIQRICTKIQCEGKMSRLEKKMSGLGKMYVVGTHY